ncbi:MAG: nucleotide sugar dehydrogenase [Pseudomonadota bacterium]
MLDFANAATALPFHLIEAKPAISVVGLGYVGAVSTACLASLGHTVVGVDIDTTKVAQIDAGQAPIHEADLGRLLSEGVEAGLISATDNLARAVRETDVTFVSVGTPTAPDGGCDHRYIEAAAREMARGLAAKHGFHVFAMRCSIPPGTTMGVMAPILEQESGKVLGRDFGVAFNPEFLREGVAVADFHAPPKTVIGATCDRTANIMRQIYLPVDPDPIATSIETAEMVKYVDNVWHAAKVCFANEVGRLSKAVGVDGHAVMDVFCRDTKLNLSPYYLKPGFAYGGSCLPKEVRAVAHIAGQAGVSLPMIGGLTTSNDTQVAEAVRLVRQTGARRVAVLGVAFKPGTDDLRESPALEVIAALREAGVEVVAHDPAVTADTAIESQLAYVRHASPGLAALADDLRGMLADSAEAALDGADAVVVTQANPDYAALIEDVLQAGTAHVVDVVRALSELPESRRYHGIGW